ncbi:MAG TPA: PrsW family intramembrane metalloprotease [Candidatus Binatia bacterium]|nr:PrsW family intramembrane metalloprotease [Candidatus Binatia bacterium]
MRRAVLVLVAAIVGWSLVDLVVTLIATPPVIVVGAGAPALVFALAIARVDPDRAPAALLAAAFVWGASVAPLVSLALNDSVRAWLGATIGAPRTAVLAPAVVGPLIEESAKGAALAMLVLARPRAIAGPIDGLVYGAMVGIGFTMAENLSYLAIAAVQGGQGGLERAVYTRAVLGGFNHAAFTATTGAAVGAALRGRAGVARAGAIVAGFTAAVVQHAIWNVVGSRAITALLCDPEIPGGPCRASPAARRLYVDIPLVLVACVGPGIAVLAVVAGAARHRARRRTIAAGAGARDG